MDNRLPAGLRGRAIKEINMDKDKIIDGLRMTMDLCVFDPSTGEEIEPHVPYKEGIIMRGLDETFMEL